VLGNEQVSDAGKTEARSPRSAPAPALAGQAMKATKGKANPAQVNEILRRRLAG
jgi:aspartyl-tRNA(Asn)/glutamyl-tRNA(Gln) amidotransferase subunit B